MNSKKILAALGLTSCAANNAYCNTLAGFCTLATELKTLAGYTYILGPTLGNVEYMRTLPVLIEPAEKYQPQGGKTRDYQLYLDRLASQNNAKCLLGEFAELQQITLSHSAGTYTFYIPTGNDFYTYFMQLIGAQKTAQNAPATIENIEFSAITTTAIVPSIKKALRFVFGDPLRPALTGVCLHFKGETLHVVATDAHSLYRSGTHTVEVSAEVGRMCIIPASAAKELAKVKGDSTVTIAVSATHAQVRVSETGAVYTFELVAATYPNYENVIPGYSEKMNFDKRTLAEKIKAIMPAANKTTRQVNFHLNGSIEMTACDIDMKLESVSKMNYSAKSFPDMDIALNGHLLLNILSAIDGKSADMYSAGHSRRAVLFAGEKSADILLLMPLQIG